MEWNVKSDANAMQLKQKGEVPYFVFPNLEKTHLVRHGFSTRFGGVSKGHLSEMNLSYTRGDNPEYVTENFCRIADAIGFLPESLVLSQQTHTTNIRLVTKEDKGKGFTKPLDYENIDGLITNVPGLTLATFYADCVPLFFVDPVSHSIGLSHAGWRGTLKRMGAKTVAQMVREFHTEPEHLRVARTAMKSARKWQQNLRKNLQDMQMNGWYTAPKRENTTLICGVPMRLHFWRPG